MTSTWIDIMRMEIDNVDPSTLVEPQHEQNEADNVVGVLSEDCKRIYGVATQLAKAADEMTITARYSPVPSERETATNKIQELQGKSQLMMDIFWISIRDEFSLWGRPNVGVCKGWVVVWSDARPHGLQIFGLGGM